MPGSHHKLGIAGIRRGLETAARHSLTERHSITHLGILQTSSLGAHAGHACTKHTAPTALRDITADPLHLLEWVALAAHLAGRDSSIVCIYWKIELPGCVPLMGMALLRWGMRSFCLAWSSSPIYRSVFVFFCLFDILFLLRCSLNLSWVVRPNML